MTEQPEHTDIPGAEEHTGLRESLTTVFRERAFFYVMLVLLVVLTLFLVWPFLSAILLGLAAVVITRPVYDWFMSKRWVRGRSMWAVALTIVASLLLIAIPATIFISIAVSQAMSMIETFPSPPGSLSISALQESYESLLDQFMGDAPPDLTILEQLQFRQLSDTVTEWLSEIIVAIGVAIPSFLVNGVIVLAIMMVLLPIYRQPNRGTVASIIPFPDSITNLYLDKVQAMMRSMFLGTFIIAFAQGAAMGLVLWIAGVPNSVFLALVSMVLSLLPVIGVSLVAWPAAILLLLSGQIWQAIFVIVMLIAVVGNIDAVLRPMLVPREAYLNPALTLLSIFGGLQLLGLVGALYGPVIMILLVTSIEVYAKYIMRGDLAPYLHEDGSLDLEKLGLTPSAEDGAEASGLAGMANRLLGRLLSRPGGADATAQDAPDDVTGL
jgi:predicted PurR-regulated permease PerM